MDAKYGVGVTPTTRFRLVAFRYIAQAPPLLAGTSRESFWNTTCTSHCARAEGADSECLLSRVV